MEKCSTIMAISIKNRGKDATAVQNILTKYGCNIMTRLGLHEGTLDQCSTMGLILLQLCGNDNLPENMKNELEALESVNAKYMKLDF